MFPARRVRRLFPVQAANPCPPLPPVDGSPVRRVLPVDLTTARPSVLLAKRPTWVAPRTRSALPSSRRFSPHIPRSSWTPADPRGPHPHGPSVWASGTLKPSPSAFPLLRGCIKLQGVRSPLRSMWFPVYASAGSFGFTTLLSNCNTRYGWLVGPYPAGTLTLQEAPSFAWRTNSPASAARRPGPSGTKRR